MAERRKTKQPTERTLDECRRRGWLAGVVERWKPGFRKDPRTGQVEQIPYGTRLDFLGFADILALDGRGGYLAIQACAGASVAARLQKALDVPELKPHLEQGNRFQVWGWREMWVTGKTGQTKRRQWVARIVSVHLRDGMLFHEEEIVERGGDATRSSKTGPMLESDSVSNVAPVAAELPGRSRPCPLCKGRGLTLAVDAINKDGSMENPRRDVPCMACDGTGALPGREVQPILFQDEER